MNQEIQPKNTVIVARNLGETLEVILRTDDFSRACLIFLEEWQKDHRVCMLDFTPSIVIAAAAKREHDDQEVRAQEWSR